MKQIMVRLTTGIAMLGGCTVSTGLTPEDAATVIHDHVRNAAPRVIEVSDLAVHVVSVGEFAQPVRDVTFHLMFRDREPRGIDLPSGRDTTILLSAVFRELDGVWDVTNYDSVTVDVVAKFKEQERRFDYDLIWLAHRSLADAYGSWALRQMRDAGHALEEGDIASMEQIDSAMARGLDSVGLVGLARPPAADTRWGVVQAFDGMEGPVLWVAPREPSSPLICAELMGNPEGRPGPDEFSWLASEGVHCRGGTLGPHGPGTFAAIRDSIANVRLVEKDVTPF